MKAKKINMANVLGAAVGGAAFNAAISYAAKMNDKINNNFINAKGIGGLVVGTGVLYFGKSEALKAAGYGIIGAGGAALSNKLVFAQTTTDEPVQGMKKFDVGNIMRGRKKKNLPQREMIRQLAATVKQTGRIPMMTRESMPASNMAQIVNRLKSKASSGAIGYGSGCGLYS